MPTKRRIPKERNPLITDEAVALFRRGLALQRRGAHERDYKTESTPEQDEYAEIARRLHWQLLDCAAAVGPLDIAAGEWADVPDDVVDDGTYRGSVPHARELHRLLKKEIRR